MSIVACGTLYPKVKFYGTTGTQNIWSNVRGEQESNGSEEKLFNRALRHAVQCLSSARLCVLRYGPKHGRTMYCVARDLEGQRRTFVSFDFFIERVL